MKRIYIGNIYKVTQEDIEKWKNERVNPFSDTKLKAIGTLEEKGIETFKNQLGVLQYVENGAFPNVSIEKVLDDLDYFRTSF